MKKILWLLVLGVIIYFQGSAFYLDVRADQAIFPCASLTSVSGPIKYGATSSETFTLYNPDEAKQLKIMEQDRIITGDETTAELLLSGTARIEIREKSQIQVGYYSLRIKKGDIWVNYKPSKTGEKAAFKVITPAGTVGIKGTTFEVRVADENGPVRIRVIEGQVSFETPAAKESALISTGEELSVETGKPLGTPAKFKADVVPAGQGEVVRENLPATVQNQEPAPQPVEPVRQPSKKFNGFDDMSGYSIEIIKK